MKHQAPAVCFLMSGALFAWGTAAGNEILGTLSIVAAGLGLTLLLPSVRRWHIRSDSGVRERLEQIENRLELTESELDSAAEQLAHLKNERDFEKALRSAGGASKGEPPGSAIPR
ncbi:MAG: hypothetical protein ACRENP_07490 [Longimicrobiales bacterium]